MMTSTIAPAIDAMTCQAFMFLAFQSGRAGQGQGLSPDPPTEWPRLLDEREDA